MNFVALDSLDRLQVRQLNIRRIFSSLGSRFLCIVLPAAWR